ncbi:DUF6502 family protein [Marinicella litoralis]|uniref:Uncharacterized protein n=1 Tax=Marinicella litoralis TaxID=644220 RepID=A0A4R6XMI0_9GAMM|nr:DUF6502 family protein [Marinicella litoralis]TDR19579.1 hypothetical protein C8D91_2136 [Marinicella litoralis]
MNQQVTNNRNLSFDVYWLSFIRTCMRPLIKILVKQKVEFNSFQNLVRELFVEEAERYIDETSENSRGKISSIAYQTGLDRREVSKIIKNSEEKSDYIEQNRSREANILEHWKHMPPFCDEAGNPIPLKRSGKGLSFETLCQRFGKNISHGPILDSLLKAKCVEIIDNKVHFLNKSYTPPSGINIEMSNIAAASIKRIINTIHHNIFSDDEPNFQRNLYSIRIKQEHAAEFKRRANEMIRKIYHEIITPEFDQIESQLETLESRAKNKPVGLGIFYFED